MAAAHVCGGDPSVTSCALLTPPHLAGISSAPAEDPSRAEFDLGPTLRAHSHPFAASPGVSETTGRGRTLTRHTEETRNNCNKKRIQSDRFFPPVSDCNVHTNLLCVATTRQNGRPPAPDAAPIRRAHRPDQINSKTQYSRPKLASEMSARWGGWRMMVPPFHSSPVRCLHPRPSCIPLLKEKH
jgi:hypothetical protein